jgi:hypothetical protein
MVSLNRIVGVLQSNSIDEIKSKLLSINEEFDLDTQNGNLHINHKGSDIEYILKQDGTIETKSLSTRKISNSPSPSVSALEGYVDGHYPNMPVYDTGGSGGSVLQPKSSDVDNTQRTPGGAEAAGEPGDWAWASPTSATIAPPGPNIGRPHELYVKYQITFEGNATVSDGHTAIGYAAFPDESQSPTAGWYLDWNGDSNMEVVVVDTDGSKRRKTVDGEGLKHTNDLAPSYGWIYSRGDTEKLEIIVGHSEWTASDDPDDNPYQRFTFEPGIEDAPWYGYNWIKAFADTKTDLSGESSDAVQTKILNYKFWRAGFDELV